MVLQGRGVTLREHGPEDLQAVHAWHGDPEVMKFLSWGAETLEQSLLYLSECIRDQHRPVRSRYRLAIVEEQSALVAGGGSIHWRVRGLGGGDGRLGCFLAREFQGRGLARETTRLLVEFGLYELGMHRISATCLAGNTSSERTLRGLGFVWEGTMRRHSHRSGHWLDRHFFSVLKEEWGRT